MREPLRPWTLPLLLALAAAGPAHGGTPPPAPTAARAAPEYVTFSEERMSTRIDATLPQGPGAREAAAVVFDAFSQVEETANEWRESSPLAAVNRGAGGPPVPVPQDLFDLLRRGVEMGELTGGAFEVTWAALWGLWTFSGPDPKPPPEEAIRARLPLIDFRAVELDPAKRTARLPREGMKIGLGGIAKGLALDRAAAALRARGIGSFSLSSGGQVTVAGLRGDRPWRVGIRDPRGSRDDAFALVEVSDASVSTTGDYERYFVREGVRYHHVLDPRTGWPARGVRSATVIAADGTLADALSTGLFVLGPSRGIALVESLPGVEAVMVDDAARVHASSGIRDRLLWNHAPKP
ncbi:FAD:protein FMN transferase [Myxococcota bacterium]|nr:FAD:protein FMN transferase [Myxococcota bacterium]